MRAQERTPLGTIMAPARRHAAAVWATGLVSVLAWVALSLRAPVLTWAAQPLPFEAIHAQGWHFGWLTDIMLLLTLLLAAYLTFAWVVLRSPSALPATAILGVGGLSSLSAVLTYPLFAEDVYLMLAQVWTLVGAHQNPYAVAPDAVTGNPFAVFTGLGYLPYVYGPAWLPLGGVAMILLGPNPLAHLLTSKLLQLVSLWLLAGLAWSTARASGVRQPLGAAGLVLWNPVFLVDGIMTPHLDLPMAVALLGALLAWRHGRVALAILLLALSVGLKLVPMVLVPAILLGMAASGSFRGTAGRGGVVAALVTVALAALLWPVVWRPLLQHGLPMLLGLSSNAAFVLNVVTFLQTVGLAPSTLDPEAIGLRARWFLYAPFWFWATARVVRRARQQSEDHPAHRYEMLALLLLGYHVLFTIAVGPWNFTTVLALCLLAGTRRGVVAGLLVTGSCILFWVNAQWVWDLLWEDLVRIGWILSFSLLIGPLLAMVLLPRWLPTPAPDIAGPGQKLKRGASGHGGGVCVGSLGD